MPERNRFEARSGRELVGFADYVRRDGVVVFPHTEVPPAYEGQGIGSVLARAVLDDARARDVKVIPSCPFIAAYIERHPEYEDLVAG